MTLDQQLNVFMLLAWFSEAPDAASQTRHEIS
jgi:hypothetical protein